MPALNIFVNILFNFDPPISYYLIQNLILRFDSLRPANCGILNQSRGIAKLKPRISYLNVVDYRNDKLVITSNRCYEHKLANIDLSIL